MTLAPANSTDRIPVAPFREAFLASGMSLAQMACAFGWEKHGRSGKACGFDSSRAARLLGLAPVGRCEHPTEWILYDRAVLVVRALGLDPVDLGV